MTARFILSLDCEGKWGVADCLGPAEHRSLSDERLQRSYRDLLGLLDHFSTPATFAFVGLFGESRSSFDGLRPQVEQLAINAKYLQPALDDIASGSKEGWHGDWAVDAVGSARIRHEIALHGVTHVPWSSAGREVIEAELGLYRCLTSEVGRSTTFVFPRNAVAHVDALPRFGIGGYRQAPPARSRLGSLLSEFNVAAAPQSPQPDHHGLVRIPSGYFVNWQSGLRRVVPDAVSVARLDRMISRAGRTGEIVHFWLHPENIASAPATLDLLRDLLSTVVRYRDRGECEVLTQEQYVREFAKVPQRQAQGAITTASPSTTTAPSSL